MHGIAAKPTVGRDMGPVASKILKGIKRARSRDVVDLDAYRAARQRGDDGTGAPGLSDEVVRQLEGFPPSTRFWMGAFAELMRFMAPCLGLRELARLAQRLDAAEEAYMPGGPPTSPVTDSFFNLWAFLDTGIGLKRETLADVAVALAGPVRAPAELVAAWRGLARSYPGLFRVVEVAEGAVVLEELVTAERREVELSESFPIDRGELWWVRVLPPPRDGMKAAHLGAPYAFPEASAEAEWCSYFERQLDGGKGDLASAYRKLMKRGPAQPYGWLDYVLDAYVGVRGSMIGLAGVPDRPETLARSPGTDAGGELGTPLERVGEKLLELVHDLGLHVVAADEFLDARELVCDRLGLEDGSDEQQPFATFELPLLVAHSKYAATNDRGQTALDSIDANALADEDERQVLSDLREAWFSVFEVTDIVIDESLELKDVLRGRRVRVTERVGTRDISLGEHLAAWVMPRGDGFVLEGASVRFPRLGAAHAVESLQQAMKGMRKAWRCSWRERHARFAPLVVALVRSMVEHPVTPTLVNRDGESVVMAEAR